MITRDEYVKNVKNQLDKLNTGIDKIENKVKSVSEGVKDKLQLRVKYLREKRDAVFAKIKEVKDTSEETWNDLKHGTENTIIVLKDALKKTLAHFRKKKSDDLITGKLSE